MGNFSKYYDDFSLGQRYSYLDKNICYKTSLKAIDEGYQVQYGRSNTGIYYFEIVDPFNKTDDTHKE